RQADLLSPPLGRGWSFGAAADFGGSPQRRRGGDRRTRPSVPPPSADEALRPSGRSFHARATRLFSPSAFSVTFHLLSRLYQQRADVPTPLFRGRVRPEEVTWQRKGIRLREDRSPSPSSCARHPAATAAPLPSPGGSRNPRWRGISCSTWAAGRPWSCPPKR